MAKNRSHLDALTGIRAFAAIWILFFHTNIAEFHFIPRAIRNYIATGYSAVSLFFVLSGFILAYTYLPRWQEDVDKRAETKKFWLARFARVYPLYLLSFIVLAIYFYGFKHQLVTKSLSLDIASAIGRVLGIHALVPRLLGGLNFASWSVSCEFFFYALFPVIGFRLAKKPVKHLPTGLFVAALACLVVPMITTLLMGTTWQKHPLISDFVQCNPIVRFPEFIFGVLLGQYYLSAQVEGLQKRAVAMFAGGLILTWVLSSSIFALPSVFLHSGGMAIPFALMIVSLATNSGIFCRFFSTKTLVYLGEISYGIYIMQFPVKQPLGEIRGGNSILAHLITLAAVIAVPAILHPTFEKPVRSWILRKK